MIIDVNGFRLHYETRGDGAPLLLLHGGTGIGADWTLVFTDADPAGFRVIVPDLRGHGRSTNPRRLHLPRSGRGRCSRCSITSRFRASRRSA